MRAWLMERDFVQRCWPAAASPQQPRATNAHRASSTTSGSLLNPFFILGAGGERHPVSSARPLGQGPLRVIRCYSLQVVVLAASPRENEQARTHSVRCLSGVPSVGPLNAATVVQQEWRSWPSSLGCHFPFLFAEDTRERLVHATRILRSPRTKPRRPVPGWKASGWE